MRKLITMLLVLASAPLFAQSIQLIPLHSTTAYYTVDSFKIVSDVTIKNVSNSQIVVHVKRMTNNIDLAGGQASQFCFNGQCYSTTQDDNPVEKDLPMNPGQEAVGLQGLIVDFLPWSVCSSTNGEIVMRVSNVNSSTDFTDLTFTYVCGVVSIDVKAAANSLSNPYPNPANIATNVDYQLPIDIKTATVTVTDVMGRNVYSQVVNDRKGTLEIPTTDLSAGIYYMNIMGDGQMLTSKRVMVQH